MATAIGNDQQGDYVLVVEAGDIVARRSIVKGPLIPEGCAIRTGLTANVPGDVADFGADRHSPFINRNQHIAREHAGLNGGADRDGGVFAYGEAKYDGSSPDTSLDCVGIALREDA